MKENITESIHCVRLMKHSYINTILKETEINVTINGNTLELSYNNAIYV